MSHNLKQSLIKEFVEAFVDEKEKSLGGNAYIKMGMKVKYFANFLFDALEKQRKEDLEEFKHFAFHEVDQPCEPDCTPGRHAYHSGRYDSWQLIESWVEKKVDELNKPGGTK